MFRSKKNEEQLPKAMRQMQKEKEERENFFEQQRKNENSPKNKHSKNKSKHGKDLNYKQILKRKKIKKIIIICIIVVILILGIILGVSAHNWKQITTDMFANENSIVVDSGGNVIAELGSERKKIKIEPKDMPENLENAYVSIEDERYYKHHGVDIKRTASAIVSYIFHAGS